MSDEQKPSSDSSSNSKAEPSGPRGDSSATGDSKKADPTVRSGTPEGAVGKLNPSAPGDTGTTPGTNAM